MFNTTIIKAIPSEEIGVNTAALNAAVALTVEDLTNEERTYLCLDRARKFNIFIRTGQFGGFDKRK